MQELLKGVSQVRGLVNEISSASAAQSGGIREVDASVRSIDGTTQQNAALVEQVAAAAQHLSKQTEVLTELTRKFRVPSLSLEG
jgi:methyl-accepting chemotaxis protein